MDRTSRLSGLLESVQTIARGWSDLELGKVLREMARERAHVAGTTPEMRSYFWSRAALKHVFTGIPPRGETRALAISPRPISPLLGHTSLLTDGDRTSNLSRLRNEYGDLVRLRFVGLPVHLVSSPEPAGEILSAHHRRFHKNVRGLLKLRLALGLGLLTTEGETWTRQRRIAHPAFQHRKIASFAPRMSRMAREMVQGWRDGEELDIHHAMMAVTLRIVGDTMLSTDVASDAGRIGAAVSTVIEDVNDRVNEVFDSSTFSPSPRNLRFQEAMVTLDTTVLNMIRQRMVSESLDNDLLQLFMQARDEETGERLSEVELRDQVMTIFLAGHETTANALSWALYLLSRHPEERRKVEEEADQAGPLEAFDESTLQHLPYTRQVILEAMRLYPPVWVIARGVAEDTELDGKFVPEGSLLLVSPWTIHRHPAYWDHPEHGPADKFAPARFAGLPLHKLVPEGQHKFAYLPFGAGPRQCIGASFAMMEATLILATIARLARIHVTTDKVETEPLITLRPQAGIPARIERRC